METSKELKMALTRQQLLVLAILFFIVVALIGCAALIAAGRIVP